MDLFYLGLFLFISTGWGFIRSFLIDKKKIVIPS